MGTLIAIIATILFIGFIIYLNLRSALYDGLVGRSWRESLLKQRDESIRQEYRVQLETLDFDNRVLRTRLEDTLSDLTLANERIEVLETNLIQLITNIGVQK